MEDAPQETEEAQPAEVLIEEDATEPEASAESDNLDGFTPIDLSADMTELIKAAEEAAAKQYSCQHRPWAADLSF